MNVASRPFLAAAWVGAILYGVVALISLLGLVASREAGIHRIHDFSSVVDFGLFAGVGFAAQLRRSWRSVGLAQLALLTAVLMAALYGIPLVAGGQIVGLVILGALVLGPPIALVRLHPDGAARVVRPSAALIGLAVVGLVASLPYAATQLIEQINAPAGDDHAVEMHYAGMAVLAVSLGLAGALAGIKVEGWKLIGRLAVIGTVLLGALSIFIPDGVSSLGVTGGAIASVFAVAYWLMLERQR